MHRWNHRLRAVFLGMPLLVLASCKQTSTDTIDAAAPLPATALIVTPLGQGNGFLVDREDRLLLASHATVGASAEVEVIFPALEEGKAKAKRDFYMKQAPRLRAKVLRADPQCDLVALQVVSVPEGIQELKLATATVQADEPLHLVLDAGSKVQLWSCRDSTARGVSRQDMVNSNGQPVNCRMVETNLDGKFAKGATGAALVNDNGELVGMVTGAAVGKPRVLGIDGSEIKDFLSSVYGALGTAAVKKGDYGQAVAFCDKALRYKPDEARTHNERGAALSYLNKYDEAIAEYTKAIAEYTKTNKHDAGLRRAYRNRGSAYLYKGKLDEAVADCSAAIKLDPTYVAAYQTRSAAYLKLNKPELARVDNETIQELTRPIYKSVDSP